ncbi:MAG: SUMF1/EgtB/PvdO family nonheme iron enzyme [Deltaproteobacteria bacterium]|nr:SUMF1/EgtB/PvdO family nonheme iron enzyme [Deltaproteobacteria bacterium]
MSVRSLAAGLALTLLAAVAAGCGIEPYCLACTDPTLDAFGSFDAGLTDAPDAGPIDAFFAPIDTSACIPVGEEVCNENDDDCDGTMDEGFDLTSNPEHCGGCGRACRFPNVDVTCVASECELGDCLPGFVDLDTAPGCEHRCDVFPTTTEQCNGLDDDCDGEVDEPADLPAPPDDLCRSTPGTPCASTVAICTNRAGVTTWFCDYPSGVEFDPIVPNGIVLDETRCDGFDGDCDGLEDEVFADLGASCDNGARGACRDAGTVVCDATDVTRTTCDLTALPDPTPGAPSTELCNGIDDDCDGTVDNSDPGDPARIRDDLVHVVRGGRDFWIYRHEASRPDASATLGGVSSARSCSRAGVQPWTRVAYDDAQAACAAAGFRLCTSAEWQSACEGASATTYPYGASYAPMSCNGADRAESPAIATTGAIPLCVSTEGALDLSGNVKEWTADARGTSAAGDPIYVVRGGSYDSPALGLTCQTDLSRATDDTLLGTLGFRCCSSTAP